MGFITDTLRVEPGAAILAGVSGGPDSVVMLHLLVEAGYRVSVAHANFGLRASESDRDESFVRMLAKKYSLPCAVKHFEVSVEMVEKGISLQMAARNLRYRWFNQLAEEQSCSYIAVAHHLDDQIETFFINLLRGTGLKGLKGMPARQGNLIRPLLFAFQNEITDFAATQELPFVVDSSNLKTDYLRNQLRAEILPLLARTNPSFSRTMASNMARLKATQEFVDYSVGQITKNLLNTKDHQTLIDITKLQETGHAEFLLHHISRPFGFNHDSISNILTTHHSGKLFYSQTHKLLRDRNFLIISAMEDEQHADQQYLITEECRHIRTPVQLELSVMHTHEVVLPLNDSVLACLDFDAVRYPLFLRRWRPGDRFSPLGLIGKKKLSDYFISKRYTLEQKKQAWLLVDNLDRILWIVGDRIDHSFRITPDTRKVLCIRYIAV